ncbi:hypothetical protein BDP27DRAFT_1368093 [Rhodocollybia butyracea]|uniref:Uncharacterized protein n=1 Tax=Rhodocollybia butyracea TaxID=206335 RepID=A0A9P5PHN1_9AGAR|nr:hypothetical protein BDP27DRAFT_1368093 [Rhodocollybia butyracea]
MPNNIIQTLDPPIRAGTPHNPVTLGPVHSRHVPVAELTQVKVGGLLHAFAGHQVGVRRARVVRAETGDSPRMGFGDVGEVDLSGDEICQSQKQREGEMEEKEEEDRPRDGLVDMSQKLYLRYYYRAIHVRVGRRGQRGVVLWRWRRWLWRMYSVVRMDVTNLSATESAAEGAQAVKYPAAANEGVVVSVRNQEENCGCCQFEERNWEGKSSSWNQSLHLVSTLVKRGEGLVETLFRIEKFSGPIRVLNIVRTTEDVHESWKRKATC